MHRYNTMPLLNQYSKLASQWTQSTIHLKQFQSHFLRTQFEIQSTTLKSLPIKQTAFSPTHTYIHTYPIAHTYIYIHKWKHIWMCEGRKGAGTFKMACSAPSLTAGYRRRASAERARRSDSKTAMKAIFEALSLSHWFGENGVNFFSRVSR